MVNYKFCKRLLGYLRLRRNKKIALHLRRKRVFLRTLKYNVVKRQYFLSNDYLYQACLSNEGTKKSITSINVTKKQGGILSYLYMVICKFPKKYIYQFLGKEIYRGYYIMPLRLSINRFVSFLTYKGYYGVQCARYIKPLKKSLSKKTTQEITKRIMLDVERTLNNSILRILRFKPTSTAKIGSINHVRVHKVKSPWSIISSVYIKQLINHGHIYINNKLALFNKAKIDICDVISLSLNERKQRQGDPTVAWSAEASITKIFYVVYRNMHYINRLNVIQQQEFKHKHKHNNNIENSFIWLLDAIKFDFTSLILWPMLSLFRTSGITKISSSRPEGSSSAKDDKWNKHLQLQRLLRWKRLQNRRITNRRKITILDKTSIINRIKQDPSLMYSKFSRCYASIVYGTRQCEWILLQQRRDKTFYRALGLYKTNFLEVELEYFQLLLK